MSQAPTAAPISKNQYKRSGMIVLILSVVAVAGVARWQMAPPVDPLRGDAEDSSSALDAHLSKMPVSAQEEQLKKFANDASPGLRFNAIDKLSERHDRKFVDILEHSYTDSSAVVRQRILEALPDTDPKRGLVLLLKGLQDEDRWMREAAIQQLKTRFASPGNSDKRIVPALIGTLDDKSDSVSFTAVHMLQKLTGNPWIYKSAAPDTEKQAVHQHWKTWWQTAKANWEAVPGDLTPQKPTRIDPSPDFKINDIDGKAISLAGQNGHVTLINFWGTWCAPCQQEIPDLVRVDKDFRSRGVDVVGVALSENSADSLRKWCKSHQVAYHQSLAQDKMLKDFGDIHEVPITVLIDSKGNIRRRWEGERDYATFKNAIDDTLATK